jgi:hypothetical protein
VPHLHQSRLQPKSPGPVRKKKLTAGRTEPPSGLQRRRLNGETAAVPPGSNRRTLHSMPPGSANTRSAA